MPIYRYSEAAVTAAAAPATTTAPPTEQGVDYEPSAAEAAATETAGPLAYLGATILELTNFLNSGDSNRGGSAGEKTP